MITCLFLIPDDSNTWRTEWMTRQPGAYARIPAPNILTVPVCFGKLGTRGIATSSFPTLSFAFGSIAHHRYDGVRERQAKKKSPDTRIDGTHHGAAARW